MAITVDLDLVSITCCDSTCGITFAVPVRWQERKREDHSWFYCPNGHHQHYTGQTAAEKAKAEAERLRGELAASRQTAKFLRHERDHLERSRNTYKGHLTKVKRRVANGVCPCCNRHFEDLHRHMETKHPEYGEAAS